MNFLEEQFKKAGDSVTLSERERSVLRAAVLSHIKGNPVIPATANRSWRIFALSLRRSVVATLLLLLVFTGGGISYAAEDSVPGMLLYEVKVRVNEEIRGSLALSAEDRAEWEARRIERRLEETSRLALTDTLTDERKERIEEEIERHARELAAAVDELEQEEGAGSALAVEVRAETGIDAHESVFFQLRGDQTKEAEARATELFQRAREKTFSIRERSLAAAEGVEGEFTVENAADTMTLKAVESESFDAVFGEPGAGASRGTDSYSNMEDAETHRRITSRLEAKAEDELRFLSDLVEADADEIGKDDEVYAKVREIVESTTRAFSQGKQALKEGDYVEAQALFQAVLEESHRVSIYLQSGDSAVRPALLRSLFCVTCWEAVPEDAENEAVEDALLPENDEDGFSDSEILDGTERVVTPPTSAEEVPSGDLLPFAPPVRTILGSDLQKLGN